MSQLEYDVRDDEHVDEWRKKVFARDRYACVICGVKGRTMNAHHKDGYNWCYERRYDVTNGATMCFYCHTKFHDEYGYGNNCEEQFNEFKKMYAIQMEFDL